MKAHLPSVSVVVSTLVAVLGASAPALACETDNDCAGGKTCRAGECTMPKGEGDKAGLERPGTLIVGAERVFGWATVDSTVKSKNADPVVETTSSQSNSGFLASSSTSALTVARMAFDYHAGSGVTLGGALGYATGSGESDTKVGSLSSHEEAPKSSAFVFAPRIGWLTMSGVVGFWARAGLTYFSTKQESTSGAELTHTTIEGSGTSAQLEPALLLAPIEHVLFSFGAHANFALGGSSKSESTSRAPGSSTSSSFEFDSKVGSYGVSAGVHTWF